MNFTSPEKLMFRRPDITKSAVAAYYRAVSARMLPYLHKRILSLVRCPKGIAEPCFFKKHPVAGSTGITEVSVKNSAGKEHPYFYVTGLSGLLSEVQMNTLEFHVWGSTAEHIDKPDMMVFDLDPDEGMNLPQIRRGAEDLKNVLDGLSLTSYLKTSGGKGYHAVVPFAPKADWTIFQAFAKRVAEFMEQKWPDRYTSNVRKKNRQGKIFIDWIRNGRSATSIAPYSVRARAGARVSMPIAWRELHTVAPDGITMEEAVKRLREKDPWEDFFETMAKQRLK